MDFLDIYEIGKSNPLKFKIPLDEKRLKFARFPYRSEDIVGTTIAIMLLIIFLSYFFSMFSSVFSTTIIFVGIIVCLIIYIYPSHIFYYKSVMQYNEEMLRAIMRLSNYILMNTSLEYAFIQTAKEISGTLRYEFDEILIKLSRKEKTTIGDVFEEYVDRWNKFNPTFVKSLRLLQTANLASDEDKKMIVEEVIETLMLEYTTMAKRSIEEISGKSKNLVAFGVLLPLTSLMILPLLSIFMPDYVKPIYLVFVYNIFFPAVLFLMALNFSTKRIQIDTVDITQSPHYEPINGFIYVISAIIIFIFIIPSVMHFLSMDLSSVATASKEYSFQGVFASWLPTFGIVLAIFIFNKYYIHKYHKLWESVWMTEQDLPHLLEIFSTYLTLNMSVENIIPLVVEDYEKHGFSKHPIVKIFKKINQGLIISKLGIQELIKKVLFDVCPSKKVSNLINQIISFTDTSQESSAKASKVIRKQLISISRLDDYMKTLLSETVSLINITALMLAPLLSAVSVLMSLAVVKSLNYISEQLGLIQSAFGSGAGSSLNLVDVTTIIPPTIIESIVGIYYIEMLLVLSLFATNIKIGMDSFQTAKTIDSNITGYVIYSIILLGGHFLIVEMFFKGVFG